MMAWRKIAGTIGAAGVVVSLAACGGGGSDSPSGAGDSGSSSGSGNGGSQEITMWGGWAGDQIAQINQMLDKYNASQDSYKVKYVSQKALEEKLLTGIASGRVPDVMIWDRWQTPTYAEKGALESLDGLISEDDVDMDVFFDQAVKELTVNDTVYGLPWTVDARAVVYNVKMLEDAGVEPPTDWDTLRSAAEKLTVRDGKKLKVSGFQLSDPGLFSMYLGQAGGSMLNEDQTATNFNNEKGMEVLDFWKSLLDAGVYEVGFGEGIDVFSAGETAMVYDGPWNAANFDKVESLEWAVAPPISGPTGDKASGMGGFGLAIAKGAKNVEGAWDFMKWWTLNPENGVEFAKLSGNIPGNKIATEDSYFTEDPKLHGFVETLNVAKIRPTVPGYSDMETKALIPALQKFMAGSLTAEQALSQAQVEGDRLLAEAQK